MLTNLLFPKAGDQEKPPDSHSHEASGHHDQPQAPTHNGHSSGTDTGHPANAPLRQPMETLITSYSEHLQLVKPAFTPIHVDEIASKIATFYELIRKVIDWKEDNLLRRAATERILKRLLFPNLSGIINLSSVNTTQLAETVTTELIRGGHLPNDEIPREKLIQVAVALKKYLYFLTHSPYSSSDPLVIKQRINFATFIIEIAACEIEEILISPQKENALIRAMTEVMDARIVVHPTSLISPEDKRTQVFIAVCRTLFDLDDPYIMYHLLKFSFAEWTNPTPEFLASTAPNFHDIWNSMEQELNHPLAKQFYTKCERMDTIFLLINDILDDYRNSPELIAPVFRNKQKVNEELTKHYDRRYQTLKKRLFRLAVFSTLSVFISNWFTFYIVEVPLAKLFYEGFNLMGAIIDFTVPTLAMFILVAIIKPPPKTNIVSVLAAAKSIMYADEKTDLYEIRIRTSKPVFTILTVSLYIILTIAFFWAVGYVFYKAGLPVTSVIFDTLTIAINIFAAVGIRNKSKELNVDEKSSLREFALDMLSVPVAKIGSFLSSKWKEYNIVAIFFNFFIETPLVMIIEFIEHWSQFLKDRKAEIH